MRIKNLNIKENRVKILVKTSDVIEINAKNFEEAKELFLNQFFSENPKRINYPIEIFEVVDADIEDGEKDPMNKEEVNNKKT